MMMLIMTCKDAPNDRSFLLEDSALNHVKAEYSGYTCRYGF